VTLGEPLELSLPVDPSLHEGASAMMEIWRSWYPGACEPVPIDADLLKPGIPDPDRNCGQGEKCLRTLTGFELVGRLDRCTSFPQVRNAILGSVLILSAIPFYCILHYRRPAPAGESSTP
jgi:hypothetical protein